MNLLLMGLLVQYRENRSQKIGTALQPVGVKRHQVLTLRVSQAVIELCSRNAPGSFERFLRPIAMPRDVLLAITLEALEVHLNSFRYRCCGVTL